MEKTLETNLDGLVGPFYDRTGESINYETYCTLRENFEYRIVKRTVFDQGEVITAWLGKDECACTHANHAPHIFGTITYGVPPAMRYAEDDLWGEEIVASTEKAALENHEKLVATLQQQLTV